MFRPSRSPVWRCSQTAGVFIIAWMVLGASTSYVSETVGVKIVTPTVDAHRGDVVVELPAAAVARFKTTPFSDDDWVRLFSVHLDRPDVADTAAILGSYSITDAGLAFTPRFPFVGDVDYIVVLDCRRLSDIANTECDSNTVSKRFRLDTTEVNPSTTVSAVYPTADVLPENLLKFYVYFSAPMAQGSAFTSVQIVDAEGNIVPDAFVETTPELWDPDMRRLTLICHPGKIKRGLEMRKSLGPALREGNQYRLVVDTSMSDAFGNPLASRFEKPFSIVAADRRSPDLQQWTIESPQHDGIDPLVVRFDEPLDHALAGRVISVERDGVTVDGAVKLSGAENEWHFRPRDKWAPGTYSLAVQSTLEDLAGNSINRLFDSSPTDTRDLETQTVWRIEFSIPAKDR